MKTVNGKECLTAKDLAIKWGLSEFHIRNMARAKQIPSFKIRGRVYFPPNIVYESRQKQTSVLD